MDQGGIWLPQKIAPMPGKIIGAAADVFTHSGWVWGGTLNTWPQIDHCGHQEGGNIIVCAPWQEGLLILSYNEGVICNSLADYYKRKEIVKYPELLITGNVLVV